MSSFSPGNFKATAANAKVTLAASEKLVDSVLITTRDNDGVINVGSIFVGIPGADGNQSIPIEPGAEFRMIPNPGKRLDLAKIAVRVASSGDSVSWLAGVAAKIELMAGTPVSATPPPPPPAPTPDQPTIGTPTVTAQVGDVLSIQWPIAMAATGIVAAALTVNVYDATDTTFATPLAPQQVFAAGIGLGANLVVTFAGLDGMDGPTPRSFVIRAEAT